jgi:tetratricopeptide (TPR) repeat protein
MALLEPLIQSSEHTEKHIYQATAAFVAMHWGNLLFELGRTDEASRRFDTADQLWRQVTGPAVSPTNDYYYGRWLVTAVDTNRRNPRRAGELSAQAVERAPQNADFHQLLGAARLQSGDITGAVNSLNQASQHRGEANDADSFWLAMAHARRGEDAEARASYRRGYEWFAKHRPGNRDIARLRDEAATALGIPRGPKPPEP